jgi:hypothetical protein
MCLLRAASSTRLAEACRRRRAADAAACGAAKTTRNGWIDATKRLKKLERRVGGGTAVTPHRPEACRWLNPPPLTPAPYNARYSGLERRDLRRTDTTPSRRQKITATAT